MVFLESGHGPPFSLRVQVSIPVLPIITSGLSERTPCNVYGEAQIGRILPLESGGGEVGFACENGMVAGFLEIGGQGDVLFGQSFPAPAFGTIGALLGGNELSDPVTGGILSRHDGCSRRRAD